MVGFILKMQELSPRERKLRHLHDFRMKHLQIWTGYSLCLDTSLDAKTEFLK